MTMTSPKLHIRRLAIEDVAKRSVTCVARTRKHCEIAIDLLGEEHTVAVVRQESVLKLMKCLEVLCPCDADGWTVIAIAPCNIIAVLNEANTWVVAIYPLAYLLVVALETKWLFVDVPVYAVLRETYMEHHTTVGVVATEHSCKALAERNYGTVEYTVACRKQVTRNDRVL